MSVKIMTLVWERAPYSAGTLLVFLALADWSNDDGIAWPSMEGLAEKARLDKRSAQRIVRQLVKDGMLIIEEGGGRKKRHRYFIQVERVTNCHRLLNRKGDISDMETVTFDTERVTSHAETVTPVSPDPSVDPLDIKPSLEPPYAGASFLAALNSFKKHRADIKKPLTSEAERLLYRKLEQWGEGVATLALEDAVINRWQGVFLPRDGNGNGANQQNLGIRNPSTSDFELKFKSTIG